MPIIPTSTSLAQDEELHLSTRRIHKHRIPPFLPIGQAGMSKYKIAGLDTGNILKDLSTAATWLFWTLESKRNKATNETILLSKFLSKTEQNRVAKGYKELHQKGVIKRIKREHYIINPKAVLPSFEFYEDVWASWENLP